MANGEVLRLDFDHRLMLQFRGSSSGECGGVIMLGTSRFVLE